MTQSDENLRALWLAQMTPHSSAQVDELTLAQWLEGTLDATQAERVEAFLAESREGRDLMYAARQAVQPETPSEDLEQQLRALVAEEFRPSSRKDVLWTFSLRAAAAAAAVAISALGFVSGRSAAPATNQVTNDFVSVVTFDVLSDQDQFDSILSIAGLTINIDSDQEGQAP